jgi:hypothetical protein
MTEKEGNKVGDTISGEIKKKKTFWGKLGTFMMMGGFMLVLIVIVALVVGISIAVNSCGAH